MKSPKSPIANTIQEDNTDAHVPKMMFRAAVSPEFRTTVVGQIIAGS